MEVLLKLIQENSKVVIGPVSFILTAQQRFQHHYMKSKASFWIIKLQTLNSPTNSI